MVGQDSLDLTRELLERQLGRQPQDQEVLETVASDYGVAAEQVFPVEQPGEFHLDMRMSPLAPGVMALQDSQLSAQMQAAWIREELGSTMTEAWNQEVEDMVKAGDEAARYEALARRDLEKAGLKVVPMAGVFRNMNSTKVDGAPAARPGPPAGGTPLFLGSRTKSRDPAQARRPQMPHQATRRAGLIRTRGRAISPTSALFPSDNICRGPEPVQRR